jgi:hypothetical protein
MGKIKLATRSCFWIDPLVKPVRLAALKRIAYDKPIRKQLILSKLVQSNDNHMNVLERLAIEAKINDLPISNQEGTKEQSEPVTNEEIKEQSESVTNEEIKEKSESVTNEEIKEQLESITKSNEKEEIIEDFSPTFKPFLNRIGQLIINPVGRSKEFFSKHNQQLHSDFVKPISSDLLNGEQSKNDNINRYTPLGCGHRINNESAISENIPNRPQSIPVSNAAAAAVFHHSEEHSPFQTLGNLQQSTIDSNVTTPSEIGPNKMTEIETKNEQEEEEEEDDDDEVFQVINYI